MESQHQVLATLRASLPKARALLSASVDGSRNATARRVCEAFGFVDARSRLQQVTCLKALRTLDAEGLIDLPVGQAAVPTAKPCILHRSIPRAEGVPGTVGEVEGFKILLVDNRSDRAIWNTLMTREHPRGMTTFVGTQLKYLIHSRHGYLGAVGFAAAAYYLKARDQWITWSPRQRVVNLNRFLIRPDVQCRNLASYALGRVLGRLRDDFRIRYGYAPYLVETFVGPDQEGPCFKAANFRLFGAEQGTRAACAHPCP